MFKPHIGNCSICPRTGVPIVIKAGWCDKCNHKAKEARKQQRVKVQAHPARSGKTMSSLVEMYDIIFSMFRRKIDADENGYVQCCTCHHYFKWNEVDCGHFMPRAEYVLRWDFKNTAPQCRGNNCNSHPNGNQEEFAKYIDSRYGEGTSEGLRRQKHVMIRLDKEWLQLQIKNTKQKLNKLHHIT